MATFKDIEKANSTIKTMQISRYDKKQGKTIVKDYAEVNQRIKAFRQLYPEGFIRSNILSHVDGVVVIKSEVGFTDEAGNERVLGTGIAFENQKSGMINGTSYIENCETSAVGRALGMLGLGIDISIASYEEVTNAMEQQENPAPPNIMEAFTCCLCGSSFTDKKIAKATYDKFGKYVCPACVSKKTKEAQAREEVVTPPPPPPVEPFPDDKLPFQI